MWQRLSNVDNVPYKQNMQHKFVKGNILDILHINLQYVLFLYFKKY